MSPTSHVFHEIFLHINWHCHGDAALIVPSMEAALHTAVRDYCGRYRGVRFMAVGGTRTHVHLVVQAEPTVAPSEFIGKVKGFSGHEINRQFGAKALQWQRGYGVVSFAKKHLAGIIRYVENQKEHHEQGTAREALERSFVDAPGRDAEVNREAR